MSVFTAKQNGVYKRCQMFQQMPRETLIIKNRIFVLTVDRNCLSVPRTVHVV